MVCVVQHTPNFLLNLWLTQICVYVFDICMLTSVMYMTLISICFSLEIICTHLHTDVKLQKCQKFNWEIFGLLQSIPSMQHGQSQINCFLTKLSFPQSSFCKYTSLFRPGELETEDLTSDPHICIWLLLTWYLRPQVLSGHSGSTS